MNQPVLVILGGPNGAGKTTFAESRDLVFLDELGITSFDYDIEFKKLYEKFLNVMSDYVEEGIADRTKLLFEDMVDKSIAQRQHFSFQTNYDKFYIDDIRKRFDQNGFQTALYFLYVDSIDLCKTRVQKRVSEGGHSVPNDEIVSRYKNGLKNLDNTFLNFDRLIIIDTSNEENILLFEMSYTKIVTLHRNFIDVVINNKLKNIENWLNSQQ